jgi:dipeptidase
MGCDTLVALAAATRDGVTLFGKNSDRPPDECQRIVQVPRHRHAPDETLRCQYVTIPQVAETVAVVGSQPHWLWGFEHGVNEHQIAIGNEMVFAKEALGPTGLLGMDLVRLGLERGRDADEALDVMTTLLERYGQGGSGQRDVDWPYHNAFLIADPRRAWVLETSARHWVARPVHDTANISNGLGIGTEWTRGAPDVTAFALERGWWTAGAERLDFTRAYAEQAGVPANLCAARRARLSALLAESRGQLSAGSVRGMLRDHYADRMHVPRPFEHREHFSVCMHSPGLSHTTASLVAPLAGDGERVAAIWACLGNPCLGVFLPLYPQARIPERLAAGGAEPDDASPWWVLHRLRCAVERDPARSAPRVRARWEELESDLVREAARLDEAAAPVAALESFMERALDTCLASARTLTRECA